VSRPYSYLVVWDPQDVLREPAEKSDGFDGADTTLEIARSVSSNVQKGTSASECQQDSHQHRRTFPILDVALPLHLWSFDFVAGAKVIEVFFFECYMGNRFHSLIHQLMNFHFLSHRNHGYLRHLQRCCKVCPWIVHGNRSKTSASQFCRPSLYVLCRQCGAPYDVHFRKKQSSTVLLRIVHIIQWQERLRNEHKNNLQPPPLGQLLQTLPPLQFARNFCSAGARYRVYS